MPTGARSPAMKRSGRSRARSGGEQTWTAVAKGDEQLSPSLLLPHERARHAARTNTTRWTRDRLAGPSAQLAASRSAHRLLRGLVARQPLLVASGLRGGMRLTVSPLADVPPTTRVPLSPLGDPHASLYPLIGHGSRLVGPDAGACGPATGACGPATGASGPAARQVLARVCGRERPKGLSSAPRGLCAPSAPALNAGWTDLALSLDGREQ